MSRSDVAALRRCSGALVAAWRLVCQQAQVQVHANRASLRDTRDNTRRILVLEEALAKAAMALEDAITLSWAEHDLRRDGVIQPRKPGP